MIGEVEVNQGRWKVENEDGSGERRTWTLGACNLHTAAIPNPAVERPLQIRRTVTLPARERLSLSTSCTRSGVH
jgi:hypothetical protein